VDEDDVLHSSHEMTSLVLAGLGHCGPGNGAIPTGKEEEMAQDVTALAA
jgi:hypothetical protein